MAEEIDLVPLMRQRLVRDMLPCDHDYWDVLDMVRPSEDVEEVAHQESHVRMATVEPYEKFLLVYATLTSDIMTEVMYKNVRKTAGWPQDPEVVAQFEQWHGIVQAQNREIVAGAVFPIIAHMLEAGLIKHGEVEN